MKKYLKFFIPIFIFFIGFSVNAKGTMFIANGTVLNQCTGTTCRYDFAGTTNLRFIGDNTNFELDHKYTFKLNFSATTSMASPTLTDCGLNINGAYVSPESRNSGRVSYECNQDYSRCDSTYVSTIIYTIPSSLTSVPYFIQCDMTPTATRYTYTNFTMSISDSNGSVIQAIDNNTDRIIEVNNYNANQNNANRDRNTNKITDKIQDFMDAVSTGIGNIISGLTTLGSNIVNGIGTAISNGVNALISAMDGLQMGINAVVSKIAEIGSNIVNAIGNGVSSIVNKIGELILGQKVCDNQTIDKTSGTFIGYLKNDGTFQDSPNGYSVTTDYIEIAEESELIGKQGNATDRLCFYNANNLNISCLNQVLEGPIQVPNATKYIRLTINTPTNLPQLDIRTCQNGNQSIFQRISDFFKNALGLNQIGTILNKHKNILDNSAFDSLSDFIHSPINFIHSLESTSCNGLTLTVFNQNFTLPSGCIFWSREDVSSFRDFWNLLFGGLLLYRMGYRLFKALNDSIDPTKDDLGGLEI